MYNPTKNVDQSTGSAHSHGGQEHPTVLRRDSEVAVQHTSHTPNMSTSSKSARKPNIGRTSRAPSTQAQTAALTSQSLHNARYSQGNPHRTSLTRSLEPATTGIPKSSHPTMAHPFVQSLLPPRTREEYIQQAHQVNERFNSICRVYVEIATQGEQWRPLTILGTDLMSRNGAEFFCFFSEMLGAIEIHPILRFELLDIVTNVILTNCFVVSRHNHEAFEDMKKYLFRNFSASFITNPSISTFRVMVHGISLSIPVDPPSQQRAIWGLVQTVPITIRIQLNEDDEVSRPFQHTVLTPQMSTFEFFGWFASQTGYIETDGPEELRFSFKDVVPTPTTNTIRRGNEEHFQYMTKDILKKYNKTVELVPELKEFAIMVTVPCWRRTRAI